MTIFPPCSPSALQACCLFSVRGLISPLLRHSCQPLACLCALYAMIIHLGIGQLVRSQSNES